MSGARAEILERVRSALRDVPASEGPEDVAVEGGYRHSFGLDGDRLVTHFAERVADYRATVHRVGVDEIAATLASRCEALGASRLVAPVDLPAEWRPEGVEVLEDEGLSHHELDGVDGVVSGCALGIAETGTIVLDGGARQGRRAISLLPDLHFCVVFEDQIVGGVPEAFEALEAGVRGEKRPVTFISGPSATSDIELNRVEGVHGPRTLEVVIAG